jgi:hypothetical protein
MTECSSCGTVLVPDNAVPDTKYQFENALWIGFYGGYGMFVDNLNAKLPNNTEDRWLRDEDGEYLVGTECICVAQDATAPMQFHEFKCPCRNPIDNPDWKPTYNEERILDQPDYEAVLCHDCAHGLCEREPWLFKLINPHGSHAHRTAWKKAHPEHWGWDYDHA